MYINTVYICMSACMYIGMHACMSSMNAVTYLLKSRFDSWLYIRNVISIAWIFYLNEIEMRVCSLQISPPRTPEWREWTPCPPMVLLPSPPATPTWPTHLSLVDDNPLLRQEGQTERPMPILVCPSSRELDHMTHGSSKARCVIFPMRVFIVPPSVFPFVKDLHQQSWNCSLY